MKRYAVFSRLFAGVMLLIVWGLTDSPLSGVVFLLLLTALSATRYRVSLLQWLKYCEAAICIGYTFVWLPALLALWFPVISMLEERWDAFEKELLEKALEDRGERLKLEAFQEASVREVHNAARIAEMAERARIAQDIHDHVGHEISGALIALQTAIKLRERNDERANELLDQSAKRLESASEKLREAVHNLKPSRLVGLETLEDLCCDFSFCDVRFDTSGDFTDISHWHLLASNLKEMLTNVARHSTATLVSVRLDGNADLIRMQVSDNGHTTKAPKPGLGLTGMSDRVRAAGGTLTVSAEKGFSVVTVLPRR